LPNEDQDHVKLSQDSQDTVLDPSPWRSGVNGAFAFCYKIIDNKLTTIYE